MQKGVAVGLRLLILLILSLLLLLRFIFYGMLGTLEFFRIKQLMYRMWFIELLHMCIGLCQPVLILDDCMTYILGEDKTVTTAIIGEDKTVTRS